MIYIFSYDSESDDEFNAINAQFVRQAHFGGFDDDDSKQKKKNPNLIGLGLFFYVWY